MPSARHTNYAPALLHPGADGWPGRTADGSGDSTWPAGLRALLMITGAVHPDDAALARVSNDDIALLRVSMNMLLGGNEPTSAA
ncbi:MAG: hypothetical protein WCJ55_11450 [Chloroflexales bacterium]